MEPALNPVVDLLTRAARAGNTVLPVDVVLRSCSRPDADAALGSGEVVEVEWEGAPALALTDVAESEELLADGLASLAEENRLAVVVGEDAAARRRTLDDALAGVPSVVLDDAHAVGLDEVLAVVEDLQEDAVLALCLDPALPLAPVPGAVALDLARSGACPVLKATAAPPRSALDRARADVAAGRWPTPDPDDRSLVEVRVASPEEAVVRVAQLVSTSVPRAFGVPASDVVVLLGPGSVPDAAVREAVGGGVTVLPLDEAGGVTAQAAVVVLAPPGPALTRAAVYAGLRAASRHVSLVHGADPQSLSAAMAGTPDRPRRTRLAALLSG